MSAFGLPNDVRFNSYLSPALSIRMPLALRLTVKTLTMCLLKLLPSHVQVSEGSLKLSKVEYIRDSTPRALHAGGMFRSEERRVGKECPV